MALQMYSTDTAHADRDGQWQLAGQDGSQATPSAFFAEREAYQHHRHHVQHLHRQCEQERQVYQQEQAYLWEHLRERRRLRGEEDQPIHVEQQLRQLREDFSDTLACMRQRFTSLRQVFLDRLEAISQQQALARELEDPQQRHKAYQHLHEQYQQVREELREAKALLREQQEAYRQLRLDYQASRELLQAEKAVIAQRQEIRRWQGYGYSRMGHEILLAV